MTARNLLLRTPRSLVATTTPRLTPVLLSHRPKSTATTNASTSTTDAGKTAASTLPPPERTDIPYRIASKIADMIRSRAPSLVDNYQAKTITEQLYKECASQAAFTYASISPAGDPGPPSPLSPTAEFWYTHCGRTPSFTTWAQVTILHMWTFVTRMRMLEPRLGGPKGVYQQNFIDHFFYEAEEKMVELKVKAAQRPGYMKDLFEQYRGMTVAFDEGLWSGDAVLATAIWRNIFSAREDVDIEALALVTCYVRRIISQLSNAPDEAILDGKVRFGSPLKDLDNVAKDSALLLELERKLKATAEAGRAAQRRSVNGGL